MPNRKTTVVSLLIAGLIVLNVVLGMVTVDNEPDDGLLSGVVIGFLVGQYIGQLNLISVWGAVSRGSAIVRLPWALLMAMLMWSSLILGQAAFGKWQSDLVVLIGATLGFGCIVTQIPLWIASRFFRWRLVAEDTADEQRSQFDIKQMLVGTLLLAGSLAICRQLTHNTDREDVTVTIREFGELTAFLIPMAFFNLLFVIPAIWAAFLVKVNKRRLGVATALLALVGPIELLVICAVLGYGPSASEYLNWLITFSALHLGQVFVVYGSLVLLRRLAGFRLVRLDKR